jgi:putative (di)nucleoside polyphosphate hydrolase
MRNPPDCEDSWKELLAETIIQMVMKADKVAEQELLDLLRSAAGRLAAGTQETTTVNPGRLPMPENDAAQYRPGVGIMLVNDQNEVFLGRRIDVEGEAWQMPQGGIDEHEGPQRAAFRELKEEIGTVDAEIIAESKGWLHYDLPPELVGKAWDGRWRGQRQKWFVMRFKGHDSDINLKTEHPEFSEWKWVPIERLPDLIISFKRQLYTDILREFSEISNGT